MIVITISKEQAKYLLDGKASVFIPVPNPAEDLEPIGICCEQDIMDPVDGPDGWRDGINWQTQSDRGDL